MKNPLKRVEELIPLLPEKDAKLCANYLSKRNFVAILEIVEANLYKTRVDKLEELPNNYVGDLHLLRHYLTTYMLYLDIPDDTDNYDDYQWEKV